MMQQYMGELAHKLLLINWDLNKLSLREKIYSWRIQKIFFLYYEWYILVLDFGAKKNIANLRKLIYI